AIPLQGGIGHINEQWPTYWVEEFAKQGLVVIDAVRPAARDNRRVAHWYSQNCLLFATEEAIRARPRLAEARDASNLVPVDLVHPSFYLFHRLNLPGQVARVPLDIVSEESIGEPEPEPEPDPEPQPVQTVEADETIASAAVAAPVPPLGLRALLRQIPRATGLAVSTRWKRWAGSRRRTP